MRHFRLTLCYEGTRYKGWQRQGNTPDTLQAKLEELLGRILEQEVELAGSGRTDAGVHARRQVCSFRADTAMSSAELLAALRRALKKRTAGVTTIVVAQRISSILGADEILVLNGRKSAGADPGSRTTIWTTSICTANGPMGSLPRI